MLKIGEFSKLSRVSIRMLRHYDAIGLLVPEEIDPYTGYRYYRENQLILAGRISSFRDMGFSLAAIREMLRCYEKPEAMEQYFRIRESELRSLAQETAYRLQLLDTAREWLRKDHMQYNITIKTIPERYAACLRMTIPAYDQEGILWDRLCAETESLKLIPDDPCLCSVTFYDEEYREHDVDVEAQKTVKGHYPDTEHVRFRTLPPVTVASTIHNGSYLGLDNAMETVAAWILENGYVMNGPAFCIYHVSPHETDDPDAFVTEICYPVAKP